MSHQDRPARIPCWSVGGCVCVCACTLCSCARVSPCPRVMPSVGSRVSSRSGRMRRREISPERYASVQRHTPATPRPPPRPLTRCRSTR
eukprot:1004566-Prymnesium_polylepis.1